MQIRIGKPPGRIETIDLADDATVADALSAKNLDPAGYKIRVGGQIVQMDHTLREGDQVLLVREVKGNWAIRALRKIFRR